MSSHSPVALLRSHCQVPASRLGEGHDPQELLHQVRHRHRSRHDRHHPRQPRPLRDQLQGLTPRNTVFRYCSSSHSGSKPGPGPYRVLGDDPVLHCVGEGGHQGDHPPQLPRPCQGERTGHQPALEEVRRSLPHQVRTAVATATIEIINNQFRACA